jgi:hypothetical protein
MTVRRILAFGAVTAALLFLGASPAVAAAGTAHFKDDNGIQYTVQPLGIIHPAQPSNQFDAPPAGAILVAVVFRVKDISAKHSVTDDADVDADVIASDDETYQASFDTVTECTNFDSGQFTLGPSESVTGCVVFELRKGLRATEVQWQAGFGDGGSAEWHVSP